MSMFGQKIPQSLEGQAIPLSGKVFSIVGTAAAKITPENNARFIAMRCDVGNFRVRPGNYIPQTFTAATTDILTAAAHDFENQEGPYEFSTSGTLPAGLAVDTPYYISKIDANTFKVALSPALIDAGTFIDITDTGTGTHTIKGMPAVVDPAASETRGQGALNVGAGQTVIIPAPRRLTVIGFGSTPALTYWSV